MITAISTTSLDAAALPVGIIHSDQAETFDANLPNRSLLFQVASGPLQDPGPSAGNPVSFGDDDRRLFSDLPGAAAALAAVYPVSDGLDIYAINPITGVGTLAFQVSPQAIADARTAAAADPIGEPVLLGVGMGNALYMLSTGRCWLFTTFPDGSLASFVFDC